MTIALPDPGDISAFAIAGFLLLAERYVTGGVFIGLGVTAAMAGDGRK